MTFDDYDINPDFPCPHCGHFETRSQDCPCLDCDDGEIDLYEEDPIFYAPGEVETCTECCGTGVVMWCPECGEDPRVKPQTISKK